MNGQTYSRTLGEWSAQRGNEMPEMEARSDKARWLLGVLKRECPASTKAEQATRRDLGRKVVMDYLTDVTENPPPREFWPRLGQMMASSGVESIFEAVVAAVESGAGLTPPYNENPSALLDYALAVKNGKGKR